MGLNNRAVLFPVAFVVSALLLLATFHRSDIPYWNNNGNNQGNLAGAGTDTVDPSKPRYIFVDLGANKADSLEVFLQHAGAKFQYNYPHPEWATHNQAEIYLFEANPVFNADLVNAKGKYAKEGIKVNIFPSTVVDVKDGIRTFFLDTVNTANDYWGSSIYANHPDAIKSQSKGTDLTGVNIATWLLRNFLPQDYVVVKMDIEGAEYEVIPHMADMAVWGVVDHLLVEWHGAEVGGGTPEEIQLRAAKAEAAKKKLIAEGIRMPIYDSAA